MTDIKTVHRYIEINVFIPKVSVTSKVIRLSAICIRLIIKITISIEIQNNI
jgi:hypothetical protein